jgi:acetyl-CoA carboxylase biotin carboxyl carrier protein
VWKIEKAVGDTVAQEEVLLIIESMKMEIPVESPCGGRVIEICVREGDSIEEGTVLARIG